MRGKRKEARYGQDAKAMHQVRKISGSFNFDHCLNKGKPIFTTPDELSFANILEINELSWQYEPELFALRTKAIEDNPLSLTKSSPNKITLGFQPDFYLPSQNMFVELSRTKNADRKWKKIELLQQLSPELKVILLRARELDWLETHNAEMTTLQFLQWLEKQVQKNATYLEKRDRRGKRAQL